MSENKRISDEQLRNIESALKRAVIEFGGGEGNVNINISLAIALYATVLLAEVRYLQNEIPKLKDILSVSVGALERIVLDHSAYCEHHIGVSNHSYKLAGVAEEALCELRKNDIAAKILDEISDCEE